MSGSTWTSVDCQGTGWLVDWGVVERLCMSYWRSSYQYEFANAAKMSESTWYNPFSWNLPSIRTVDVPWDKVRDAAQTACNRDLAVYRRSAPRDMRGVAFDVKWKLQQVPVFKRNFRSYLSDVQAENMAEIHKAVDDYAGLVDCARFLRNTSADVVAIGATILSGGTAAGLLGASSAMKGWSKYQDSGSLRSAALYGAGSMVLGAFKIGGAKLTSPGEYTLIFAQGVLESGTSWVAGDTFAKAIEKGGLKIASTGGSHAIFGSNLVKQVFARIPIPFKVLVKQADGKWDDKAAELVYKLAKKGTEKGGAAALDRPKAAPATEQSAVARSTGLIDEVPIQQQILLYMSMINMKEGIGHGY